MARMSDVAKLVGVSVSTVSRVLREPERVASPTRERILAAIEETGYVPNLVASSLKLRRSGIVGGVIPSVAHSIVAEATGALQEVLKSEHLTLFLGNSGFLPQEEEELVSAILARRPEAMYLTGTTHTPATVHQLRSAGIPTVETGNLTSDPIDMLVGFSNFEAARTMVLYLVSCGYRRIGYLGQTGREMVDRARDRHLGYRAALAESDLRVDDALEIECEMTFGQGALAFRTLVDRVPDLDAIFTIADPLAIGAIFEAARLGINIPGDIALTGFDDLEMASQCVPALTTVRVPRRVIGRLAGEMICSRLAGVPIAEPVIDVGFEIMVRDTTPG